ncbi:MAG TPA: hypothetical protein GX704_04845, partial [Clostridiales bacterium]|nr:hypothetical protein [Clostridiales bacterium]
MNKILHPSKHGKDLYTSERFFQVRVLLLVLLICASFPAMTGCQDKKKGSQDIMETVPTLTTAVDTEASPEPIPEPKKPFVIKHGWEFPTVSFVAANIRKMEKRPVDGVAIRMDDKLSEKVMRTEPVSYEQF